MLPLPFDDGKDFGTAGAGAIEVSGGGCRESGKRVRVA